MSVRDHDQELLDVLQALARSASQEHPSPGMEARLLEEFDRRRAEKNGVAPRAAERRSGRSFHLQPAWWLAAAASLLLLSGAVAGRWAWRVLPAGSGARQASSMPRGDGPPRLAASALRPDAVLLPPAVDPRPSSAAAAAASARRRAARATALEFVAWPGAAALPSLESGQLVRTELPVDVIPLLGLGGAPGTRRATVAAEVILGQDGQPRAVRLVSDER